MKEEEEERIDYAFRNIYKEAILNPENKDMESVKNTIKYYLIDLARSQQEKDMSIVNDAFNEWDKTRSAGHGLDTLVDRIINMIRNEITTSTKEVYETYRELAKSVLK